MKTSIKKTSKSSEKLTAMQPEWAILELAARATNIGIMTSVSGVSKGPPSMIAFSGWIQEESWI
jgi:hypothetical protein